MKYTAKDYFPTWYKAAKVDATNHIISARLAALREIITNEDVNFWLDIVRISYGIEQVYENTTSLLVKSFLEEDTSFPVSNNEQLVKVLAACALCFRLESQDLETTEESEEEEKVNGYNRTNVNTTIALGLITLNFLGQFKNDINIPTAEYAHHYLESKSYVARTIDKDEEYEHLEDLMDKLKGGEGMNTDGNKAVINAILDLQDQKLLLAEELNVLTWIFGEYSNKAGKFFQDAGAALMIAYAPMELQEKTKHIHYLPSAKGLLHRILFISQGSKKASDTKIYDSVHGLPSDLKTTLLKQYQGQISALTPYLFAILKATEFEEGADFTAPYKKLTNGGDLKVSLAPHKIASQLYNEFVFLKTLSKCPKVKK